MNLKKMAESSCFFDVVIVLLFKLHDNLGT